jgi:hypothetical protein
MTIGNIYWLLIEPWDDPRSRLALVLGTRSEGARRIKGANAGLHNDLLKTGQGGNRAHLHQRRTGAEAA